MATVTVRGLPPALHRRLKAQAKRNGRSLNQEILRALQTFPPPPVSLNQELAQARAFRRRLRAKGVWLTAEQIEAGIQAGRRR